MTSKLFDIEQWRLIVVSIFSPVLAYLTPTKGFIQALVIAFGMNVICGMRADGISVTRCKNFSFRKFKNALIELLLYLLITQAMYAIMTVLNDQKAALIIIKTFSYIFIYIYMQNSFKNLVRAYPKIVTFRVMYYVLRLEFAKLLPAHMQEILDKVDKELNKNKDNETTGNKPQSGEERV